MTLSRERDKLMEFVNVCIYKSFQYYRIKFLQRCNLFLMVNCKIYTAKKLKNVLVRVQHQVN